MCHRRPFRPLLYQLKWRRANAGAPTTVTLGAGIFPVVLLASAGLLVPIVVIIAALVLLAILLRSA
jgi:hypothetical protein